MTHQIPVLYGTETGNSEYCAEQLADELVAAGFDAMPVDMQEFNHEDILAEPVIFIVTSTYGNGGPPFSAEAFLRYLETEELDLSHLKFAVCGLGDSTFELFAQCGKDFEKALLRGSATQMIPRVDCDTDYDMAFEEFQNAAIDYVSSNRETIFDAPVVSSKPAVAKIESVAYGRDRPFPAPLAAKTLLSQPGSNKETMHYELDLKGSDISYRVGDCFAVYPQNQPAEIAAILAALGMDSDDVVEWRGEVMGIDQVLQRACLQQITLDMMRLIASTAGNAERPAAVAMNEGGDALEAFRQAHHIIDLLKTHKTAGIGPQTFASALRKLQPRLYSVASSPTAQPDQVGLVIETLRYEWNDRSVQGVASCWLADRVDDSDAIPTYLVKNDDFQFPYDDRPVIMVGPGTGVAPFRGYLAELEARRLSNETWLFFGHQHQAFDYLYRDDLERWSQSGVLDRVDFAWSRDQADKIYVQDRIAERGADLWRWLDRGALVYVCGDAQGMAPGVAAAFAAIAEQHGGQADGQAWLEQLMVAGRYKTDVY